MVKFIRLSIVLGFFIVSYSIVEAKDVDSSNSMHAPLHNFEGGSGVYLTNLAYLPKPPKEGDVFGTPSISASTILLDGVSRYVFAVTGNMFGNIELGYSYELFDVSDWTDDIFNYTGMRASDEVTLHNFNIRVRFVDEVDSDISWMPTVTFGTHFKWNNDISKINRQLNGLGDVAGLDHDFGTEFTLMTSKCFQSAEMAQINAFG